MLQFNATYLLIQFQSFMKFKKIQMFAFDTVCVYF